MKKRRYPKYVSSFLDTRGIERLRFRKTGSKTHYFKAAFGTGAWEAEYRACLEELPLTDPAPSWPANSVGQLIDLYFQSVPFANLKFVTRKKYERVLGRFSEQYGLRNARTLRAIHVDAILARMIDRPAAAADLRKKLAILWKWAKKHRLVAENVIADTDAIKQRKGGFYTWTASDIEQFCDYWPIGSKARLMFLLALWTAGRRSDLHRLGWENVSDGWLTFSQQKVDEQVSIPIAGDLAEALAQVPHEQSAFVVNEYGKPYTAESFSNLFRRYRKEAGLTQGSLHGLRKAMATRLAESDATDAQGMAVLGHTEAKTFAGYRAKANRKKLAKQAIEKIENG